MKTTHLIPGTEEAAAQSYFRWTGS